MLKRSRQDCPSPEREKPLGCATLVCLSLAGGAGLVLGALGNALGWNQVANLWLYLDLLCPILLGLSVAGIVGRHTRYVWGRTLGASVFAWIGFCLLFIIIAYQIHPYNPPEPPSPPDPFCSPCLSGDAVATGFLVLASFPMGALLVGLIALATRGAVWSLSHLIMTRFLQKNRG